MTITELKAAYYEAQQAEEEAWQAYSKSIDLHYEKAEITLAELESRRCAVDAFIDEHKAAYAELQAAYQAMPPANIDECTCGCNECTRYEADRAIASRYQTQPELIKSEAQS